MWFIVAYNVREVGTSDITVIREIDNNLLKWVMVHAKFVKIDNKMVDLWQKTYVHSTWLQAPDLVVFGP